MVVDRVEVSWDMDKHKWLARIRTGDEVIRRYCSVPRDAEERTLQAAVQKTVQEEGYEADPERITIYR